VIYWCAIFLAISFVFCFFFMEETNYDRAPLEMVSTPIATPVTSTPKEEQLSTSIDPEKSSIIANSESNSDTAPGMVQYTKRTYLQKLALLGKKREFRLFQCMYRPLFSSRSHQLCTLASRTAAT